MSDRVTLAFNSILVLAAVAIAASVVRREWVAPARPTPATQASFHEDWESMIPPDRIMGHPAAPIQVIEFGDLECPYCASFHTSTWPTLLDQYGDALALTFLHYPLESHRFAMPSARAVECAAAQGRFSEIVSLLYERQDSLGLKPWRSFAADVGVADLAVFDECTAEKSLIDRVLEGRALGEAVGVRGTPAILVNGWYVPSPTVEEMRRVIDVLLQSGDPYPR